jgi:hypothetical protein
LLANGINIAEIRECLDSFPVHGEDELVVGTGAILRQMEEGDAHGTACVERQVSGSNMHLAFWYIICLPERPNKPWNFLSKGGFQTYITQARSKPSI